MFSEFRPALKDAFPVVCGYVPLAVVYGFMMMQAGLPWWVGPLSSIVIYSGASQYAMLPMFAAGMPAYAIAFAAGLISVRHVFYGISLLKRYPHKGLARWVLVGTLTDETYALVCALPQQTSFSRYLWISLLNYFSWCFGTFLGVAIGALAQMEVKGMDFILVALFAMLFTEMWRFQKSWFALFTALAGYAAAYFISPENALTIAMALAVAAGFVNYWRTGRQV